MPGCGGEAGRPLGLSYQAQ
ncbi:hypothetical protein E2C01_058364 [Portunus trituberculatus]|uniref:Uncharacterized protein n=1 Tax=Portunus trituberculatus TaxID=210409 RepID=A0A5B7GZN5_PORTR|nr:hypothetical protein [Portunus trituberculatus]